MKKPVSNLVWLFLIVCSLQVNGGELGPLTYEIADGQVTITDCDEGAEGELEIPAEIEGAPVTSIETFAFFNCSSLTSIIIPQAFHSQQKASDLSLTHLWPDGFFLPSSITHTPKLSIRLPLQLILTGDENTKAAIEASDTLTGPWTEWRTIVIGKNGATEVDLDEGAEQRFYRVRN